MSRKKTNQPEYGTELKLAAVRWVLAGTMRGQTFPHFFETLLFVNYPLTPVTPCRPSPILFHSHPQK